MKTEDRRHAREEDKMTCVDSQKKKAAVGGLKLIAPLADIPLRVWGRKVQPLAACLAFYRSSLSRAL